MTGKLRFALLATLCGLARPAWAEPGPLDIYGDLPGIEEVAISPSGKGIAIVGRAQGKRQLVVLDGDHKVRRIVPAGDAKLRGLRWAGEDEVLLETSITQTLAPIFTADKAELFGILVVPLDGAKPWLVFDKTQTMAKLIYGDFGTRLIDGRLQGFFSGIEFAQSSTGMDIIGSTKVLKAVDLTSNTTRQIARASANGHHESWLIDGNGRAAAAFDISTTTGHWDIKGEGGTTLASGIAPTGGAHLLCFGKDGTTVVYAVEDDKTSDTHMYEVPLTGGAATEILAGVNVDHLYVDQTNSRILGYLESGVPPKPHFFDPAQQAIVRKVYRAFPGLAVEIKEWTPNFSHLLIRTSGNGDSGSWYIVDMAKLAADAIGSERPLLLSAQVGPISTVTYHASDGVELDGILTLPPRRDPKNLPVILFPHGGPTSHDEARFDWWAQAFASRGYAVFQPNFRGSDNRDYAFIRAGYGQWGGRMQTDISDALAELAKRGIVDPKRACIMGGSYGGYAALAGVTLQHGVYRCAVAVAPVSDLQDLYSTRVHESGDANMTWRAMQESLGSPSKFSEVSPRKHAAQADAPIMLIHGKDDTVVLFHQSEAMADALHGAGKPYELVVMREEDHWLSHAVTRKQMLEAAVNFVQKYNPAD